MSNYTYHQKLKSLWEKSVDLYKKGTRGASTYFTEDELSFLSSIGQTAQEIYDFAEDYVRSGEPDYETYTILADIRRNYFLNKQNGVHSTFIVESNTLPPKDASVEGMVWLPRIISKAKAKLRGEMNPDLMYGCAGDRRFFKTHNIHPAEFLHLVEMHENDDQAIIQAVVNRTSASRGLSLSN